MGMPHARHWARWEGKRGGESRWSISPPPVCRVRVSHPPPPLFECALARVGQVSPLCPPGPSLTPPDTSRDW